MYQVKTGHEFSKIFLFILLKSDESSQGRTAGYPFCSRVSMSMEDLAHKALYLIMSSSTCPQFGLQFTSQTILFIHYGVNILIYKAFLHPISAVTTVDFQSHKNSPPNCLIFFGSQQPLNSFSQTHKGLLVTWNCPTS